MVSTEGDSFPEEEQLVINTKQSSAAANPGILWDRE
jgi:hypothetical protein